MLTIEDVRESYRDYLEENHIKAEEYSFSEYVDNNYRGEFIAGL